MYGELYTLKAQYEHDLVVAQARVDVINDLIALADRKAEKMNEQATAAEPVDVDAITDFYAQTDGNY